MPPSIEIRWIVAFTLAGVVACGSSDTEDFFDSVPNVQAGAPGAGHGAAAGSVATGGGAGRVASSGSAGSTAASGGAGGMPGAGGTEPGTGGAAGTGGGAGTGGSASGAGGDSSGTGGTSGSGGAPPLGGAPGAGMGGLAGGGGNGALAGTGGGDAGAPAAGGMAGGQGRGGAAGGSGPAQCDAVLAAATSALAEAQECNLAVSSLQCDDFVDTVCGCKTPVARIDSMATKTYLAALAALKSCPIDCPAVPCDNPTRGTCRRNESGFTDGHCVGDDTSFTPF